MGAEGWTTSWAYHRLDVNYASYRAAGAERERHVLGFVPISIHEPIMLARLMLMQKASVALDLSETDNASSNSRLEAHILSRVTSAQAASGTTIFKDCLSSLFWPKWLGTQKT